MFKKLPLVAAGLLAGLSLTAYAGHNGAGGGHMGGMSSQHMSSQGFQNSNGPNAADREQGLARAGERRNQEASSHEQADPAQKGHKMSKSQKHKPD